MDSTDELLLALHALYYRLHNHKGEKCQDSLLTKYEYFVNHGTGPDCTYAKKARHLFIEHDLPEVKRLLKEVMEKLDAS